MTQSIHAEAHSEAHYETLGIPTGRLAMWWFLASEIVIFGGLVCVFLLMRWRHPEWHAEAEHTLNAAGAVNTVVLLTSSLSAVLAHDAASKGLFKKAASYLGYTLLGGIIFLGVKSYEYAHEISHGFVPAKSMFWSFYYLMTGLHAAHVIAGMIAIFVVMLGVRKNQNPQRVELVGIYWHFVDVVWIFLFPLLYLSA